MFSLLRESDSDAEQCLGLHWQQRRRRHLQHESAHGGQNYDSRSACPTGRVTHQEALLRLILEEQPQALLHLLGLRQRPGARHAHGLDEGLDQGAGTLPTR